MASNHALVTSVVTRSTSVASLKPGETELTSAGITRGMITSTAAFPPSKSKLAVLAAGTRNAGAGNTIAAARRQKAPILEYRRMFIILSYPLWKLGAQLF